jgi:hypothetical protein
MGVIERFTARMTEKASNAMFASAMRREKAEPQPSCAIALISLIGPCEAVTNVARKSARFDQRIDATAQHRIVGQLHPRSDDLRDLYICEAGAVPAGDRIRTKGITDGENRSVMVWRIHFRWGDLRVQK